MTIASAAVAAGCAPCLATLCRTRAQQSGCAVVLVLVMCVLGGSMLPRFLMPESLQAAGRTTFNAYALDGNRRVVWYGASPADPWPGIRLLLAVTGVLFVAVLLLARRWRHA